jgi:hypothetical protein
VTFYSSKNIITRDKNNAAKILFPFPAGFALDLFSFYLYFVVLYLRYEMGLSLCIPIGELVWHFKGVSQRKHKRLEWTSVEVEKNHKNCDSYHLFWPRVRLARLFFPAQSRKSSGRYVV